MIILSPFWNNRLQTNWITGLVPWNETVTVKTTNLDVQTQQISAEKKLEKSTINKRD